MPSNKRNRLYLIASLLIASLFGCNQVDTAISDPVPGCFDGILNQGELEVDCGGPCLPCDSKMSANVNGVNWQSLGAVSSQVNGNSILISSGNSSSNISLIYTGQFINGTFNLSGGLYTDNSTGKNYTSNTGSITFLQWDNTNDLVSGLFNFTAYESTGSGDSVVVSQGKFSFVPF